MCSQHGMTLSTDYKLPRMRYKGAAGPQQQRIRAAPKQLITEVRCSRSAKLLASCSDVGLPLWSFLARHLCQPIGSLSLFGVPSSGGR